MRASFLFLLVISCFGVAFQRPLQGNPHGQWNVPPVGGDVNPLRPGGIAPDLLRSKPNAARTDKRGKQAAPHFLVAPRAFHETSGIQIYLGPFLQIAVGSTLEIKVTSSSSEPCIVRMEARYADGALAGEWRDKGTQDDVLRVDDHDTILWKAGERPGAVTIRALFRNWQTGENARSFPQKITLARPMALVDYGAWEREGNGWKRRVTVRAVLSRFGDSAGRVPVRLRIAVPPGVTPAASRLEQRAGTADKYGSFTTVQHWIDRRGASLDLDDYRVVAAVVQTP